MFLLETTTSNDFINVLKELDLSIFNTTFANIGKVIIASIGR